MDLDKVVHLPAKELAGLFIKHRVIPQRGRVRQLFVYENQRLDCGCMMYPAAVEAGFSVEDSRPLYDELQNINCHQAYSDFDAGCRSVSFHDGNDEQPSDWLNWFEAGQIVTRAFRLDFQSCLKPQHVLYQRGAKVDKGHINRWEQHNDKLLFKDCNDVPYVVNHTTELVAVLNEDGSIFRPESI